MTTSIAVHAAERYAALAQPTDPITVDPGGILRFAGVACTDLAARFGTPLHVFSPGTMRANLHALAAAARRVWPADVELRFSLKSSGWPEAARIAVREGAGLEAVGPAELDHAVGIAAPADVVAHGSARSDAELLRTARTGAFLMIDSLEEAERLARICRDEKVPVRVGLRLKLLPEVADLTFLGADRGTALREFLRREKWGMSLSAAGAAVRLLADVPHVDLAGCGVHLGRVLKDDWGFGFWAGQLTRALTWLHEQTGWWPAVLDVGGGWARRRDPNPSAWTLRPRGAEDGLAEFCALLGQGLASQGLAGPPPTLWLEPGRYLVGNAAMTLTSVVAVKRDAGMRWLLTELSTNFLPRIDTSGYHYLILPAGRMHDALADRVDVVGPTCVDSRLGADLPMPPLGPGDLLAVADTGMYTLSAANHFNGLPLPAVVSVDEAGVADIADTGGI